MVTAIVKKIGYPDVIGKENEGERCTNSVRYTNTMSANHTGT